ncbi:MAG TPA: chlorite dismutase [Acidimicrobiaceae bacterium]|nr:chlorite dismutase [Acidimicrobiaceae bacterium]HCB38016.1 chlorite dismutase [Acidimicrobiaceae bacterium]
MFARLGPGPPTACAVTAAVEAVVDESHQVVVVAVLGHKADLGFMALGPDLWRLRSLQTRLQAAGLVIVDSYVSMTEVSEYASDLPPEMRTPRLYPQLPPDGKRAFCFYPMSKRRDAVGNWYALPYEARRDLMHEHGATGRNFRGRIVQIITGSTGVDDYEWGVTLFGEHLDDLKDVVHTMRFDEASAVYAEFGPFYTGLLDDLATVLRRVGL